MTVSCRIGLVLAFLVALLSPASAGKKIVGLNFQPRHSSNVPCLFQPFFVAQQSDPFYKDLKEVKTKGRPEYRRGRNVVTNFPDTTIIWIHFWRGPAALGRCSALDRKSTRLNSSHSQISYAVFCLKKKKNKQTNR